MGGEVGEVETSEEVVDVFLGIPVFITLTGISEITVVTEFLKVFIIDVEESHYGFVVLYPLASGLTDICTLGFLYG